METILQEKRIFPIQPKHYFDHQIFLLHQNDDLESNIFFKLSLYHVTLICLILFHYWLSSSSSIDT